MKDEAYALLLVHHVLHRFIHDVVHGLAPAAHLVGGSQLALAGFHQDGLEIQQRADGRRRRGYASAALEVLQVIHGKPGLGAQLVFLHPGGHLLHGRAGAVHFVRLEHQQCLRCGDGQGVHHDELTLGILLQKRLPGSVNGLNGAAQLAGEGQKQQILFLQDGLEVFQVGFLIQRGGGGLGARAHLVKIALVVQGLPQVVKILLAVQGIGHGYHRNVQLLLEGKGEVAVAVCHEDVIHSR